MYELIYRSSAKRNLNEKDISNLLETSQRFNQKNDITGCLLLYNNQFIQLLEGDKNTIIELYNRIKKDSRHTHVILMAENEKEERQFDTWSLAYFELTTTTVKDIDKFLSLTNFIILSESSAKNTEATKIFWQQTKQILEENKL